MRKWLYDRPWIWIVVFLSCLMAGSIATLIIAEVNKPEIVKPKTPRKARGGATTMCSGSPGADCAFLFPPARGGGDDVLIVAAQGLAGIDDHVGAAGGGAT